MRKEARINVPITLDLGCGTLHFSRVGFDPFKTKALFHVMLTGGGPSLGYLILMQKTENQWHFLKALMTDYIIH